MRQWISTLMISLSLLLLSSQAMAFDHSRWNALLQQYVQSQRGGVATAVDYDGIAANREALQAYLDSLSAVTQPEFNTFSRNEKLAFLINAYNAFTVELILLENQPDSIRDIGNIFSSPWDKAFFSLLGESRTLDELEHELIRGNPTLMDPRIHFAVNCASIGCPALRASAYTGVQLDAQLEDGTRQFLSDKQRNRYNDERDALEVSKIFDWYEDDFEDAAGSLSHYLLQYSDTLGIPANRQKALDDGDMEVQFLPYDWSLNTQ